MTALRKFWSRIKRDHLGCWVWQGARTGSQGYGALSHNGRMTYAHRFAYDAFKADIGQGQVVMHLCDNPRCCNPDHLRAGSQKQNIGDARSKDRWMSEKRRAWLERQGEREREADGRFVSK